jgi:Kyakuja-Dileera-Zisupton transposase
VEITGTVRKWHLVAHIVECFPKFSLNFIKGASEVEGEILETLWSVMNEVAGMAQAMSVTHHQVIDAHMNNSNWCKMIQIGRFLDDLYHAI